MRQVVGASDLMVISPLLIVCPLQFVGAAIVSAGVCAAAWPTQAGTGVLSQVTWASHSVHLLLIPIHLLLTLLLTLLLLLLTLLCLLLFNLHLCTLPVYFLVRCVGSSERECKLARISWPCAAKCHQIFNIW